MLAQQSYPTAIYIIIPVVAIYCGIFSNLSSHYILRPKLEPFLQKLSVGSSLAIQILVDVLSNISFISYSVASCFLAVEGDQQLRVLQLYNLYWVGALLPILIYMKIANTMGISGIILSKNTFLLSLAHINIIYHYFTNTLLITLPSIFSALYTLNLLITMDGILDVRDQRSCASLTCTFVKLLYFQRRKMISHLPTIQELSENFPVSEQEIDHKMQAMRDKRSRRDTFKFNGTKPLFNKIDTKMVAKEKLMRMCLCVHLSMLKKQQQEINTVRQYYGYMNGTIQQNGKNGSSKLTSKHRKTYFNSRSKDKQNACRKSTKKIKTHKNIHGSVSPAASNQIAQAKLAIMENDNNNEQPQESAIRAQDSSQETESQSLILYLFPVRIFEFSKVISTIFSIFVNLGFGVFLCYCQSVMCTLRYGRFFDFAIAALFLPMIPRASPLEFLNTLMLATLWKFAIYGLLTIISMATKSDSSQIAVIQWKMSPYIQYISIIVMGILGVGLGVVLTSKNLWKGMLGGFLGALAGTLWVTYASIEGI